MLQGGANLTHQGDPEYDTADFNDNPAPGNLRADYVLPSRWGLRVRDAGVFWPVRVRPAVAADRGVPVPDQRSPAGLGGPAGALTPPVWPPPYLWGGGFAGVPSGRWSEEFAGSRADR